MGYEKRSRSDAVGGVVAQVYATTFVGLAVAGLGAHVHLHPEAVPPQLKALPFTTASDAMTVAQAVGAALLGATAFCRVHYALRLPLFVLVAWAAGLNTGSWLHHALQEVGFCHGPGWRMIPDLDFFSSVLYARSKSCSLINDLMVEALACTAGIYLCFAGAALVSPRRYAWPAWAATAISVGLWITFASYILVRLEWISKPAFDAVYIRGGLVLYALKTAYDTAVMRAEIEATVDKGEQADVLNLALTQMLNFLQLLIRVVTILADAKKSSKKRDD